MALLSRCLSRFGCSLISGVKVKPSIIPFRPSMPFIQNRLSKPVFDIGKYTTGKPFTNKSVMSKPISIHYPLKICHRDFTDMRVENRSVFSKPIYYPLKICRRGFTEITGNPERINNGSIMLKPISIHYPLKICRRRFTEITGNPERINNGSIMSKPISIHYPLKIYRRGFTEITGNPERINNERNGYRITKAILVSIVIIFGICVIYELIVVVTVTNSIFGNDDTHDVFYFPDQDLALVKGVLDLTGSIINLSLQTVLLSLGITTEAIKTINEDIKNEQTEIVRVRRVSTIDSLVSSIIGICFYPIIVTFEITHAILSLTFGVVQFGFIMACFMPMMFLPVIIF